MDADLTDGAAAATARERVFPQRLGEPARSMLEAVLKGRNLEAVAAKFDTRKK